MTGKVTSFLSWTVCGKWNIEHLSRKFMTTLCSWWYHQMETFPALLAFCGGNHDGDLGRHRTHFDGALMLISNTIFIAPLDVYLLQRPVHFYIKSNSANTAIIRYRQHHFVVHIWSNKFTKHSIYVCKPLDTVTHGIDFVDRFCFDIYISTNNRLIILPLQVLSVRTIAH